MASETELQRAHLEVGCMEDWTVLLVPAIALTVLGLLAYFQVPIGGCAAASAVDEFGGGARTKKRR